MSGRKEKREVGGGGTAGAAEEMHRGVSLSQALRWLFKCRHFLEAFLLPVSEEFPTVLVSLDRACRICLWSDWMVANGALHQEDLASARSPFPESLSN